MSEGKRRSIVDWKRLKSDLHTKINVRESKQDPIPSEEASVTFEPVKDIEEDRVSFETALTSTDTNTSVKTNNRSRSIDLKQGPQTVTSAVKGVGDAIRFRVKETWQSRGRSNTPVPEVVPEVEHTTVSTEPEEAELPPRLPPRPIMNSTRALSTSVLTRENQTLADVAHPSNALVTIDTHVQTAPLDPSHQDQQSLHETRVLPPPYTRTLSAPTTIPARPINEVLVPLTIERDSTAPYQVERNETDLPLVRMTSHTKQLVTAQQAQDLDLIEPSSRELFLVRTSQKWLNWSAVEKEIRVNIGTLPYIEETPPGCELCEERLIMEGPSDKAITSSGVHVCDTCGEFRILCERCARLAINLPEDPHQADHILQRIGPITIYSLKSFLNKYDLQVEDQDESTIACSQSWLNSDFAFRAPAEATTMLAQISLRPPPGMHRMSIELRIVFDEASISSEAIGVAAKQWMKTTKKPSGEISIGIEVISGDMPSSPGMPSNTVLNPIIYTSGRYTFPLTVKFADTIRMGDDQSLRIHIKSSHNTSIFKAGCPFSWYFESARMEDYGEGRHLATKGQILKRGKDVEAMKVLEKRETRDRRIGYVGTAVGLGTGVAGLGPAFSPAVQGIGAVLRR